MTALFFEEPTGIEGLVCLRCQSFADERGSFTTTYARDSLGAFGIHADFVQDNYSISKKGVLRGLHYQTPPQAKLVQVVQGAAFDVAVDLRRDSPTFGRHFSVLLDPIDRRMLFLPEGFAHGFLSLADDTVFCYKCSAYYAPDGQRGIAWNDPDLDIDWPFAPLFLSEKDAALPRLHDVFL